MRIVVRLRVHSSYVDTAYKLRSSRQKAKMYSRALRLFHVWLSAGTTRLYFFV